MVRQVSSENTHEEDSRLKRGEKKGERETPRAVQPGIRQPQRGSSGKVKSPRQMGMKRNRLSCKS